jgi:hypothetical protein
MTVTCHPELVEGGQYFCSSINRKLAGQGLPARRKIKTEFEGLGLWIMDYGVRGYPLFLYP